MGKTETKTDKVRMKKSVRKPYSSLPSQHKQDSATLFAEYERLVKEGLKEGQVHQSDQARGSNVLVVPGLVLLESRGSFRVSTIQSHELWGTFFSLCWSKLSMWRYLL